MKAEAITEQEADQQLQAVRNQIRLDPGTDYVDNVIESVIIKLGDKQSGSMPYSRQRIDEVFFMFEKKTHDEVLNRMHIKMSATCQFISSIDYWKSLPTQGEASND